MKKGYIYCLLGIITILSSCKKDEMTFTTEVETIEISAIVNNTATSGGVITSDGKPTIKERGLEWCITEKFEEGVQKVAAKQTGLGEFSCVMTDLQQRTIYYVRAYAKNDFGIIYGNVLSFITPALPTVITEDIKYETGTSFITGGNIIDEGDSTIIACGVCWSTNSLPTIKDNHTSDNVGIGKFVSLVENLKLGTKYYVRAYARNAAGVGYGETKSVKLHNYPTVTTSEVRDISYTSASCGGTISDNGGADILSCGICWVKSPAEPTIEDPLAEGLLTNGTFSVSMTELERGATYNVRAYAINSIGVGYGEQKSFTTENTSLYCTGNVAITTDYVPQNLRNPRIEFCMTLISASDEVGCGNEGCCNGGLSSYYNASRKTFNILCGNYIDDNAYHYNVGDRIIVSMSNTQYIFNGTTKNIGDNTLSSTKPIFVGWSHNNTFTWSGKVYYIKIWEDEILIRHFIPEQNDGKATLVDQITGYVCPILGSGSTSIK